MRIMTSSGFEEKLRWENSIANQDIPFVRGICRGAALRFDRAHHGDHVALEAMMNSFGIRS